MITDKQVAKLARDIETKIRRFDQAYPKVTAQISEDLKRLEAQQC